MIDRLIILALVALAVAAAWWAARIWQARSLRRMQASSPFSGLVAPGVPAVVAFSTPSCAECRTRQAPALTEIERELAGGIQIVRLSAPEHPALVDQAGILTVPATLVLDATGAVRHLNLGFADARTLVSQIRGV